ncbi:MAG: hypothetical protein EA380_10060 [Phycisphaeraceae bacterium]|nr:MAG: hypothetical protein EA380_10060 [Phycisphaeraceae bacterium]
MQNLFQYLFPLLIIGLPALSWIFQKLNENYQAKKEQEAERRRQEESLRQTVPITTRREMPEEEDPREQRRRELAARRAEQLRQLRERQEQRAGTLVSQPQAPAPPRPAGLPRPPAQASPGGITPVPPRPGMPTTRPPVRRPQQARPTQQTGQPQRSARPARQPAAPPGRPQITALPDPALTTYQAELAARSQSVTASEIGQSGDELPTARSGRAAALLGTLDLRQAIILTEILGKPSSMRSPEEQPWAGR